MAGIVHALLPGEGIACGAPGGMTSTVCEEVSCDRCVEAMARRAETVLIERGLRWNGDLYPPEALQIDLNVGGRLRCPSCGDPWLCQAGVVVSQQDASGWGRGGRYCFASHVDDPPVFGLADAAAFEGGRSEARVLFWCESCSAASALLFRHERGTVGVRWHACDHEGLAGSPGTRMMAHWERAPVAGEKRKKRAPRGR